MRMRRLAVAFMLGSVTALALPPRMVAEPVARPVERADDEFDDVGIAGLPDEIADDGSHDPKSTADPCDENNADGEGQLESEEQVEDEGRPDGERREQPYDEDLRHQRYALPALPAPLTRMPLTAGVELGLGMRAGTEGLSRVALGHALWFEYVASDDLFLGLQLAFLGVDGDDATEPRTPRRWALAPTATVRWMPTTAHNQDGWRFGARLGVGYRLTAGEPDHLALDTTVLVAVGRLGLGLRYLRALTTDSGLADTVLIVTERSTPIFSRSTRRKRKPARIGLGMHALAGGSLGSGLGLMPLGARIDLPVFLGPVLMPTVAWELLWFPGLDHPNTWVQTASAGILFHQQRGPWGFGASVGYGLAQGRRPRALGSGAIAGASVYYLLDNPGLFLGLHARAGLVDDNRALRGLLLSIGGVQIFR